METVLYSSLKKEDCVKAIKSSAIQSQKEFLDNDSLGLIYMEVNDNVLRAERMLMIPRIFKPVFIGTLQEEGKLTKISGDMGMAPGARALSLIAFAAWSVFSIVIFLLADGSIHIPGLGVRSQILFSIILGAILFQAIPNIM